MKEFDALRPNAYSYLIDDGNKKTTTKGTETCVIKRKIKFEDHKHCYLEAT